MDRLTHSEFGVVDLNVNPRAKRLVFRFNDERRLVVTVPRGYSARKVLEAIDEMAPRLRRLSEKKGECRRIDKDFRIDQPDFKMALREGIVPRVQARMSDGTLDVVYPAGTDFGSKDLQQWLVKVTEEALRHQAKLQLPVRLQELAARLGLDVTKVTIRNSHGRWGSCSTKRSINLSMYLILLPRHLQRYVMLHELTHILHMDHSPQFWAQLDAFCDCSSRDLRREMGKYTTSVFFERKPTN